MPRPATDKRERLADAALDLTYRRGFERASIAEIAQHAGVASGSVYYYFKTKDEVGRAVVDRLAARHLAAAEEWDALPGPEDRLIAFLRTYSDDGDAVRAHGSPLGSMAAELGKHSPELGVAAGLVFAAQIDWAAGEFTKLGFAGGAARARATHLIAVIEGAAALTHALDDPGPLEREAAHLERWIRKSSE